MPHVLVLINLLRRPALLLGKAPSCHPSPVALSACLPRVLLFSCPSRLSARLSARRAGRVGNGRRLCLRLRRACGCRADVVQLLAPRFAYSPSAYRPASSTRLAGRGAGRCRCLLLSVPYCLPLSLACEAGGSCLLACPYGRRSFPSCDMRVRGFCGSHSWRLPGLLRHDILMSCRRGRMSAIAVHRDSLTCFSIPIFLSAL